MKVNSSMMVGRFIVCVVFFIGSLVSVIIVMVLSRVMFEWLSFRCGRLLRNMLRYMIVKIVMMF